ncbi:HD domain-containing protein [Kineococcus arenarius]|uniref:HD domain-containing protein n=1 Tax=Kineococcus sp. SYSU DK007 TaxID=3383128 RepID=UPI003D7D8838
MQPAADTLGLGGTCTDPVRKVTVTLTALERDLLRSWWVRRLQFIAHAGAAAMVTTQNYSRLEHSLGVLALVSHFHPGDVLTRAGALLHDITSARRASWANRPVPAQRGSPPDYRLRR